MHESHAHRVARGGMAFSPTRGRPAPTGRPTQGRFLARTASNGVNLLIGLGFIAAGFGIFRRRSWVPRLSRVCAQTLIGIALGGALVCAVYLYPPALESMRSLDPALRIQGLVFLVSMIAAAVCLPIYPAIVWWTFSRPRVHALFRL